VVPFLIALGSISLLASPWLSARLKSRPHGRHRVLVPGGLLVVSLYNGYFGAGSGVMLLALLLVGVDEQLTVANALKNMLLGVATTVSAIALVLFFGGIDWTAVAPLALGVFLGSTLGPRVTRRLPADLLRPLVALIGLGLAVYLAVK
jgi:uncharacterized membrane protein YfcA